MLRTSFCIPLILFLWLLLAIELLRMKFLCTQERLVKTLAHILALILCLLSDTRWGKYKILVISSSLLCMHSVVIISIYTVSSLQWVRDLIKISLELIWCPIPALIFGYSLDQIKDINHRYKQVFCVAFYYNYVYIIGPSISYLLMHFNKYWVQKDLYFLEYLPITCLFIALVLFLIICGINSRIVQAPKKNPIHIMVLCYKYAKHHYHASEVVNMSMLDIGAAKYGERVANDLRRCVAILLILPLLCVSYTARNSLETWHYFFMKSHITSFDESYTPLVIAGIELATVPVVILTLVALKSINYFSNDMQRMKFGAAILVFTIIFKLLIARSVYKSKLNLPTQRTGHLILYNTLNCDMTVSLPVISHYDFKIQSLHHLHIDNFTFHGVLTTSYSYTCGKIELIDKYIHLNEEKVASYYFTNDGNIHGFEDNLHRDQAEKPKIRVLANLIKHKNIVLDINCKISKHELRTNSTEQLTLSNELCEVFAGDKLLLKHMFNAGAVYVLLICEDDDNDIIANQVCITPPGDVSPYYIILNIIFVEIGRAVFNIFGLSWMYIAAPTRLKMCFVQLFLKLSTFGDVFLYVVLQIILKDHSDFMKQSFVLAFSIFGLACFIVSTMFYTYPDVDDDKDEYSDDEPENARHSRRM